MIEETIVIDGVVHAYNFERSNVLHDYGKRFKEGGYALHKLFSPPEYHMPAEIYETDFRPEWLAETLFAETQVDMAVYHATPLYDLFVDGLSSFEKGVALKRAYPGRFLLYAPITAQDGPDALKAMRNIAAEHEIDGIKLYPAVYRDGKTHGWAMDDPRIAFPIFETAMELGIRNVGVHKAYPLGPANLAPFDVKDLAGAAANFPDIDFEIVHGGMAFMDATKYLLHRFGNVHINLELTLGYMLVRPYEFAEILTELLWWGDAEQLIFATGCNFAHPQPFIEGLWEFDLEQHSKRPSSELPIFGPREKQLMLGGNLARLHNIDLVELRRQIAQKELPLSHDGTLADPWSRASALFGAASER